MGCSPDFLKANLHDEVAALLRSRLDAERAANAERLLCAYLSGISAADLDGIDPQVLYGEVMSLFGFARERDPGGAKIRVYDPDAERDGWVSPHSVVEIVNDDMPFLVDSLSAELAGLGVGIHLLVHPIVPVVRDAHGTAIAVAPSGGEGAPESLMHIEIDRQDSGRRDLVASRLAAVLDDVRTGVGDWRPMLDRLEAVAAELTTAAVPPEDRDEAAAFLRWLQDDHFTFLGYRRFLFSGDETPQVRVEGEELGLLREQGSRLLGEPADMPAELRAFLRHPGPLLVTKSASRSRVHRPVPMDVVGVKLFDARGRAVGLHAFVGLFTSGVYTMSPAQIPLLRRKVAGVMARAGLPPFGHAAKALANILETYPRDELFQVSDDALMTTALGILDLMDRPRAALFVRRDEFERFVSCLVFVPRDRYDTPLRLAVQGMLESAFGGTLAAYATQVADLPLARLHFIVRTMPGAIPEVDVRELEIRIAETARSWAEHLQAALVQEHGEAAGLRLARRYAQAFPASYRERHPALEAMADIGRIERVAGEEDVALTLSRPVEAAGHEARLKLYRRGETVALSDVLPMLEAMGLRIIAELPHEVRPTDGAPTVWIHDFAVESADRAPIDLADRHHSFEEALIRVWRGEAESDGFNRLVLGAGLDWRQVSILRAYAKYMRQAGIAYSQVYIERALAENPVAAVALVELFLARFDPGCGESPEDADDRAEAVLAAVDSADDDRILRRFLNLVRATLRTSYFQRGPAGALKPYLAFKLDSRRIEDLPLPRPLVEIWIYSPRVEAIHLRGGRVGRGGIRWSDRREDFRTETLGLMKAQMVKNAVIVPVGAKGGFVLKRPPAEPGREALQAEAIACYRTMMRGLLDLTDNLTPAGVAAPKDVVRGDGDDPYLVVAADKGTASFSDIANAVSAEYGFWLGDAFASGGSRGYDHKTMGITARGAWEAVKRHFHEMGVDCQTAPFTAVGVGDPSGDVFGNGMLQSRTLRLVGAFNHSHIVIDPDPDPERSFAERERLFRLGRSWPDYDSAALSAGGGVFARSAKSIPVSPEMAARFGLAAETVTPGEMIRILLTWPADLLFFGGIGTYVKAHGESNAEVGDRANDALRVDGRDLRAKVVAEGANLAMTQLGRIEYALAGGRLNTDAIDNSAGVDTSDHEVNIKILVDGPVAAGDLTPKQRDTLLVAMTDEVAALVLRDNVLQTQAISVMEAQAPDLLDAHARFMRRLEKSGRLDRAIEFLPDEEELTRRAARKEGLTRPELAVLLAYAKIWLHDAVVESDLPDDPFLARELERYFPAAIRERFADEIANHRLRRDIVATSVTNGTVNRVGVTFVADLMEKTGAGPADVARAYIVARDAYGLDGIWQAIESLDGHVPASAQTAMFVEANRLLERATAWILRCAAPPFDIGAATAELGRGIAALEAALAGILPEDLRAGLAERADAFAAKGVPQDLAVQVANLIVLASAADIVRIAKRHAMTVEQAGGMYFAVGERFGLGRLRLAAESLPARSPWEKLAAAAMIEDLYGHQRDITARVASGAAGSPAADALAAWVEANGGTVRRTDALLGEIRAAAHVDLAMLAVANRQLRAVGEQSSPSG
ncbi:MAG: NAD-glutamate dehydrogenase [Magnetospirillum sp.]|nr:NAD-glutamate dehydrogenase [Magnetospirillum sp.]